MPKSLAFFLTAIYLIAGMGSHPKLAVGQQPATRSTVASQRPNILILMTDDMSRRCVTATGGMQAITPNIDALARRGTVMQNTVHQGAFSGAICTCSRAMILTGRPLWSVTPNQLAYAGPANLNTADKLFPEQFREEGWQTFGTGKWHNGNAALLRSFDHAEAITGGMLPFNQRDRGGAKDNAIEIGMMNPTCQRIAGPGKVEKHQTTGWSTDVFYDAAEDFLDSTWNKEKPFMMYVSTNAPHDPRHVPAEIIARFKNVYEPPNYQSIHPFDNGDMLVRDEMVYKPPHSPETVRRERAIYLAMCAQIDDRIGQLLNKLDQLGQLKNTIVLFTADHGLSVGEHGLMGKQNLYDGSWRVPMIIAGPGVPSGESRDGFAYLHGIYPTLAKLAGIRAPDYTQKFDFHDVMIGKGKGQPQLFGAYMPNVKVPNGVRAVREGNHKLLYYTHSGRRQLFDLEKDSWETNDLIGDPAHQNTADQLMAALENWMESSGDPLGKK
ncbi:MAG: sulfatase-like hydrolase/transferase [Rubripirellula sp.]|nr:sulfatase-like hydrolase/transferase [Rubripirellula sp.]